MHDYLVKRVHAGDAALLSAQDDFPLWSAPFGLMLLNHIRLKPKIEALDIGFGSGFPLLELAQRLGNSSTVYGIDPDKAAHERIYGYKPSEAIDGKTISPCIDCSDYGSCKKICKKLEKILKKEQKSLRGPAVDPKLLESLNIEAIKVVEEKK